MLSNRVNDACLGGITGISNSVSRHPLLHRFPKVALHIYVTIGLEGDTFGL